MGHRAKHLRRNWIPERLAKAKKRGIREAKRQHNKAKAKEGAKD